MWLNVVGTDVGSWDCMKASSEVPGAHLSRGWKRKSIFKMRFLGGLFIAIILFASQIAAQSPGPLRVEGHVFSARTLRPLPGAHVELWGFYPEHPLLTTTLPTATDEGGFYLLESHFASVDGDGNDRAVGYAFAFICHYGEQMKVQIMPLYRSVTPFQVYQRNVYMQVPEDVHSCDGIAG